jgi:uncharacterized membrane protein
MSKNKPSPIVEAIQAVEAETTAEIRVHLSKRLIERDPFKRASLLFHQYGMDHTTQRNAVLLYVNLRRRKFAIIGDEGAHHAFGQRAWEELAHELKRQLHSTHPENAIAHWIRRLGFRLAMEFPRE